MRISAAFFKYVELGASRFGDPSAKVSVVLDDWEGLDGASALVGEGLNSEHIDDLLFGADADEGEENRGLFGLQTNGKTMTCIGVLDNAHGPGGAIT